MTRLVPRLRRRGPQRASGRAPVAIRGDATYLITGGLGALGLAVAEWLISRGAHHMVLVGRSDPSPAAEEQLDRLRSAGATVSYVTADVAHADDVAQLMAGLRTCEEPLAGVFHAAGTLTDRSVLGLDAETFRSVAAAKIAGSANLADATADVELDLFVLFSSAAAVFGTPGQGGYAAANAFIDALAHARRLSGRAALSIAWGPWAGTGMAQGATESQALKRVGIRAYERAEGIEILDAIVSDPEHPPHQVAISVDWSTLTAARPTLPPLFSELAHNPSEVLPRVGEPGEDAPRTRIINGGDSSAELERYLIAQVGDTIGMPHADVRPDLPLDALGVDSLLGLELRDAVSDDIGIKIPIALLQRGASIGALVDGLLPLLGVNDAAS